MVFPFLFLGDVTEEKEYASGKYIGLSVWTTFLVNSISLYPYHTGRSTHLRYNIVGTRLLCTQNRCRTLQRTNITCESYIQPGVFVMAFHFRSLHFQNETGRKREDRTSKSSDRYF